MPKLSRRHSKRSHSKKQSRRKSVSRKSNSRSRKSQRRSRRSRKSQRRSRKSRKSQRRSRKSQRRSRRSRKSQRRSHKSRKSHKSERHSGQRCKSYSQSRRKHGRGRKCLEWVDKYDDVIPRAPMITPKLLEDNGMIDYKDLQFEKNVQCDKFDDKQRCRKSFDNEDSKSFNCRWNLSSNKCETLPNEYKDAETHNRLP